MQALIEEFEKSIEDQNHYLMIARNQTHPYYSGFLNSIEVLKDHLSSKKAKDLLLNKLQMSSAQFKEKPFIQMACETTVTSYFARHYSESFQYEKKANQTNNTDVDCYFEHSNFKYNIEVKCSDFAAKESIDNTHAFKFATAGRLPNLDEDFNKLSELVKIGSEKLKDESEFPKEMIKAKNMDNNMKDFLLSAHSKFPPVPNEKEVNVLVVCCGNPNDVQQWHLYLNGNEGLFTESSFYPQTEYSKVDIVIISNLYHRHHKFQEKTKIENHWNLGNAFNPTTIVSL